MKKEFDPIFTIINPQYIVGPSGGGSTEGEDTQYTDGTWIYIFADDDLDGFIANYSEPGWYRYTEDGGFDDWYSTTLPGGVTPLP